MRIAYLANPNSGNGFYRGIAPMMALELRGHRLTRLSPDDRRASAGALQGVDVLHIHRYVDDRALGLARAATAQGTAVVWDNDDDASALPRGSALERKYGGLGGKRRDAAMRKLFALAHLVTAPSVALAQRLADAGATHTAVIENFPPDQFRHAASNARGDAVTVGWIAGLEHSLDYDRLPLRAALQRLLDERPNVSVHTFGLKLGLSGDRCSNTTVVPLLELTDRAAAFDIGIAPLADIAVSRARSNIKLKEYAAAGLPWLASPIGPYAGMGESQGGRLVEDGRWYEELSRLIDKSRDRRKLASRGAKWVAGETLERNAHRWEEQFAAAIERARAAAPS